MEAEEKIRTTIRDYEDALPEKDKTMGIIAWHRMEHLMAARNGRTQPFTKLSRLAWIAASLLLLTGLYYFNFTMDEADYASVADGGWADHPIPAKTEWSSPVVDEVPVKIEPRQSFANTPAAKRTHGPENVASPSEQATPAELTHISPVHVSTVSLPPKHPKPFEIDEEMIDRKVPITEAGKQKPRLLLTWRTNDKTRTSEKITPKGSPLISVSIH